MTESATQIVPVNLLQQEESLLYDTASERAFLALLMKKPDLIIHAERDVPVAWIFRQSNQYMYRAMLYIYAQCVQNGWPMRFDDMSMLRVAQFMGREESFMRETKNLQHVRDLMVMTQHVEVDQWPAIVAAIKDAAIRVSVYREGRRLQQMALDKVGNPTARQVAFVGESKMAEIAYSQASGNPGMVRLGAVGEEFYAKCAMNADFPDHNIFSVPCWLFPRWMTLMNGGYKRKTLTIIAARPKIGKSTLLQEIARWCSVFGKVPVLYLDSEMSNEEVYSRALSAEADVPEFEILKGGFTTDPTGEFYQQVTGAMGRLSESPLYYANIAGKPVEYSISIMRQFRNHVVGDRVVKDRNGREHRVAGMGLIVYDWLKLPDAGSLKNAAEWQLLGFQASAIKDTAKELDLPCVAGAQNNRGAVGMTAKDFATTGEAFVAGSDRLAQFCNQLAILRNVDREEEQKILQKFAQREEVGDPRNRLYFNQVLHIMLQRGGPDLRDGIPLYLNRGKAKYAEAVYQIGPDGRIKSENPDGTGRWLETGAAEFLKVNNSSTKGAKEAKVISGAPAAQSLKGDQPAPSAAPSIPTFQPVAGVPQ